ncbi:CDP-glycerol glycerophosphotransferase family protein [Desulfonatronum parangueonense]
MPRDRFSANHVGGDLDVLFYPENSLHLPFLEPIHAYLKATYPDLRLGFSSPPFSPPSADQAGAGLTDQEISQLRQHGLYLADSSKVQSELAVVADVCHFRIPHLSRVVNVGHGLISKGLYYCRSPIVRRENLSELVCVPGLWHKRLLLQDVCVPIEVTGFIKSDLLFSPKAVGRSRFCEEMNLDQDKKLILFAPTFNEELSAIPVIQDKIERFATPDTVVMIKLHHMTSFEWREMYKSLSKRNDHVLLLADPDYSGMMHAADVMISDVSSMFVEFMLLNKPVVLLRNPRLREYPHFDENNIEYQVLDAVHVVKSFAELERKVQNALEYPEELSSVRERYIGELDHGRDGCSAKRAGDAISNRLRKNVASVFISPPKKLPVFVLINDETAPEPLQESMIEVRRKSLDHQPEFYLVDLQLQASQANDCFERRQSEKFGLGQALSLPMAISLAEGDLAVLLEPGWTLPPNCFKWLSNHFFWNKNAGIVKATRDVALAREAFAKFLPSTTPPFLCASFSSILLTMGIGGNSKNDRSSSPCAMVRLADFREWSATAPYPLSGNIFTELEGGLVSKGLLSLRALDVFVYPQHEPFIIWDKKTLLQLVEYLQGLGHVEEALALMKAG